MIENGRTIPSSGLIKVSINNCSSNNRNSSNCLIRLSSGAKTYRGVLNTDCNIWEFEIMFSWTNCFKSNKLSLLILSQICATNTNISNSEWIIISLQNSISERRNKTDNIWWCPGITSRIYIFNGITIKETMIYKVNTIGLSVDTSWWYN